MLIRKFAIALIASSAGLVPAISMAADAAATAAAPPRPNILVILADDVGFSDLGCYGGEIATPNLDHLAQNGLRFTQFYNTARCCPTRASLLTGLYPHQAGMGHMNHNFRGPGYEADLNTSCVTIAEVLKDSGYRTYMTGKWHLSKNIRPQPPMHSWPMQRGFEKYYGTVLGSASFFDTPVWRGNNWYSVESDPEYKTDDYYFTDALTDHAVRFVKEHVQESPVKPFFLYQAYTAAHWPLHAREKDIARYKGKFDAGYDQLRKARVKRMQKAGIISADWELTPTVGDLEKVKQREWELRCMEVYAAMLTSMDEGVGKIIAALKETGQFENTLILYLQDNGGCAEEIGRGPEPREEEVRNIRPLRPEELPSGGHPKQTRDGKPMRDGAGVMPGPADTYIGYGEKWANVSNTPFREYKHWVHEGGISTPLIAHWPKGIPRELNSSFIKDPSHLIDIMATCVDVAQTTYPATRAGSPIKPLQGISLKPALTGGKLDRNEPIFWEHESNRAVRDGKWKLVAKEDEPWELYDMDADRTEMHNLAAQHPARVKEMAAQWDAYAARCDVLPLGKWKLEPPRRAGARRVNLDQGAALDQEESPEIADRVVTATVQILEPKGDGVLVAQGGKVHGYSLFVKDGVLRFAVRRAGKLQAIAAEGMQLKPGTSVQGAIGNGGEMQLVVNDAVVAKHAGVGLLPTTPKDGVSAGHDSGDSLGDYEAPFTYGGKLGKVRVQTGDATK